MTAHVDSTVEEIERLLQVGVYQPSLRREFGDGLVDRAVATTTGMSVEQIRSERAAARAWRDRRVGATS